jgi:hypothetical protein
LITKTKKWLEQRVIVTRRTLILNFEDCYSIALPLVRSPFITFVCIIYLFLHLVGRIIVRVPVNNKVTRDIDFPSDIPRLDFRDRVIAAMNLDHTIAQLGWKTSDEGKRALAHQLATDLDIDNAFNAILNIQNNPRRKKEIVLEIVHLVSLSF